MLDSGTLGVIVVVLVIYFAAMVGISWMGRKYAKDYESYLNVGRSAGVLLMAGGAIGGHIGNGLVVGGAGEGATVGISGMAYALGCVLSYIVILLISTKIYNGNYMGPSDLLDSKYNSKVPGILYNVTCALAVIGAAASQMMAGKVLFEAFGLNGTVGLIVIAVVVFLYAQIAGLWGTMATSVVQTCVIALGVVACAVYVFADGGFAMLQDAVATGAVPDTYLSFKGLDATTWMLMLIPTTLSILIDQASWQRINSAKSAKAANLSFIVAVLVILPVSLAPVLIGMYGHVKYGSLGGTVFFDVALNALPPVLAALIVAAVLAAVMSTIDVQIIAFSAMLVRGVYKNVINPKASEDSLKKMTLVANVFLIAFSAIIALSSSSIVSLLSNVYLFGCACSLVPCMGCWIWKKATTQGAIAATAVGSVFAVLQFFNIYSLPYSAITIFVPSLVAYVAVSLMTQPKQAAEA